jgi:hypothetical protein
MTQCQRYGAVQMLNIDAIRLSKKKKRSGHGLGNPMGEGSRAKK